MHKLIQMKLLTTGLIIITVFNCLCNFLQILQQRRQNKWQPASSMLFSAKSSSKSSPGTSEAIGETLLEAGGYKGRDRKNKVGKYKDTRSLGALRAPTYSLRPFGPLRLRPSRPSGAQAV